jgi:HD-GYP domain-containing protein (c-di-GMP phosphodiesterase class II)
LLKGKIMDDSMQTLKHTQDNGESNHTLDSILEKWALSLEWLGRETEGHSKRVVELTMKLVRSLDVDEDQLIHVRRGAMLHDIGKLGISDKILLKPGPLSSEERRIMEEHPLMAFALLSPVDVLLPALDIPHYHHENWDGTGYPAGLKGEAIPLPARMFAVIDNWDALRSDRPYNTAWHVEEVVGYLKEQSGKKFDPKVVEVFLEVVEM